MHCGFCLPVCPTYRVLGEENDSPRGRLFLMRAVSEGRLELGDVVQQHLDRCLGCLACEPACPAGVEYGYLLETARHELELAGRGPGWIGRAVLSLVSGGRGAFFLFGLARVIRGLGLAGFAGRWIGGRVGLAARLLDATRPAFPRRPHSHRSGRTSAEAADAGPAPTYALLEGCVMKPLFGHVHAATRRTLLEAGFTEVNAVGQGCCGALHAHAGDLEEARALAMKNIEAFEASGASLVATDAAGCGQAMRQYPEWLTGPEWRSRAEALAERVRDVTVMLAGAPKPVSGRRGGRVAYDAPCHLVHGQREADAPMRVLDSVEGLETVSIASRDSCCGGAGIYNLVQPELSGEVLSAKLDEIEAAAVDWLATGNPGCIMQIGAGLAARGSATRVVHPVELLDRAIE